MPSPGLCFQFIVECLPEKKEIKEKTAYVKDIEKKA